MLVYAATHAGKGKIKNEDGILLGDVFVRAPIKIEVPEQGFMVVSDGVGGYAGGHMAVEFILTELRYRRFWGGGLDVASMLEFLHELNRTLIKTSAKIPHYASMACTLTGIYLDHRQNYLVHTGDTRAYTKRGRALTQLTEDHTVFQEMRAAGQSAKATPLDKTIITSCFGGGNPELLAKLTVMPLNARGIILLTSDGIHDYVDLDVLADIMTKCANPAAMCETMREEALNAGSQDDMSVVIMNI